MNAYNAAISDYGSRKFIMAAAGLVMSGVLLWFGKIDGTDFVALNSVLGGTYMAANAYVTKRLPAPQNNSTTEYKH